MFGWLIFAEGSLLSAQSPSVFKIRFPGNETNSWGPRRGGRLEFFRAALDPGSHRSPGGGKAPSADSRPRAGRVAPALALSRRESAGGGLEAAARDPPRGGPRPRPAARGPSLPPAELEPASVRPCTASRRPCCCRCSSPCLRPLRPPRRQSALRGAWCGGRGCRPESFCPCAISIYRPSTRRAKTSPARPQVAFSRRLCLPLRPSARFPVRVPRRDRASRESARRLRGALPRCCGSACSRSWSPLLFPPCSRTQNWGGSRKQSL